MSLIEFLLARLAEDEAPTFELLPFECEPGCCAPAGWAGHRCLICGGATEYGGTVEAITEIAREHEEKVHQRPRALADVAAKRRIIDGFTEAGRYYNWIQATDEERDADAERYRIAKLLAQPYADHPDYRDDWRP